MLSRRSLTAALATTPAWVRRVRADAVWPERPVRILIPFAPGGAADTLARILSESFKEEARGLPLIVENRPGAGGTLAAASTAQAVGDGHTLLMGDIGANAVAGALFPSLPYAIDKAFVHVIHLANLPMAMIAHPSVGGGTLQGLIAAARQKPGGLNYASAGPGGASHLMMELFNRLAGVQTQHIPYRGGGPVLQAVLTNEVQVAFSTVSTTRPFIESGGVRAIGVGGRHVVPVLPAVRPVAETVAGFEAETWHGIHAPATVPPDIAAEINRVFNALLRRPDVLARMEQQSAMAVGGTSEAYAAFVRREIDKWSRVVRDSAIRMAN
ncbi:MAG: Bug family tripartite tricarboxylate transporter substrate binding protein [Phreatobacter sp.]